MSLEKLMNLFLPSGLLESFKLIDVKEIIDEKSTKTDFHIWLDEKNNLPKEKVGYESKGFLKVKTIQDFPIRGKAVFLHVRRRIWRDKKGIQPDIKSTYNFEAKGVKLTEELAAFLKE